STFVLLDGVPQQLPLASSTRNLAQTFRVGPSGRPVDDPSYNEQNLAFRGIGLKPYAPVHLRAQDTGGDLVVTWIRRTRVDGDIWDVPDVPLGEAREAYRVVVKQGAVTIREDEVTAPRWVYDAAMRAEDGLQGAYEISVAQISDRFGPGSVASISVGGV
ncbi:MAG: host specificity protein, partial [Pseudomonadota bacterium]